MEGKGQDVYEFANKLGIFSPTEDQLTVLRSVSKKLNSQDAEEVLDEILSPEVKAAIANPENIFGRYVIVTKIGEGGMGSVWKAFDAELGRYIALKFIKSERAEKLKSEAKTLAQLEHKNIASIYDIGSARGKGYIAMRYVDGTTFGRGDVTSPLQVMIAVCEAVDYAHKHGIIHRDIKPDNIMIDKDGNVFVMDFGLAVKNPKEGELCGTPGFIAPEIAAGKAASVASDVYSLAATLYYLLAKRPPLEFGASDSLQTIIEKTRTQPPIPIRQLVPSIAPELEAIINKGLDRVRVKRYISSFDLREDIWRYLHGFPVRAFGGSVTYRIKKAIVRNKIIVTICAAALLLVSIGGIYGYLMYLESHKSVEQRDESRKAEGRARLEQEKDRKKLLDSFRREASAKTELVLTLRRAGKNDEMRRKSSSLDELYKEVQGTGRQLAEVECMMGRFHRALMDYYKATEFVDRACSIDIQYGPAIYEKFVLQSRQYGKLYEATKRKFESQRFIASGEGVIVAGKINNISIKKLETFEPKLQNIRTSLSNLVRRLDNLVRDGKKWVPNVDESHVQCANAVLLTFNGMFENDAGTLSRAKILLSEVFGKEEFPGEACAVLGEIASFEQQYDKSEEWYTRGIEKDRGNEDFILDRGRVRNVRGFFRLNQGETPTEFYNLAEDDFSNVIKLNPSLKDAWLSRGILRMNKAYYLEQTKQDPVREYADAIVDLSRAVELDTKDPEPFLVRGMTLHNNGYHMAVNGKDPSALYDSSECDLKKALELDKNDYKATLTLGIVNFHRVEYSAKKAKVVASIYDPVEQQMKAAISLDPANFEGWLWLGVLLLNKGAALETNGESPIATYSQAEESLSRSISINADIYNSWLMRAAVRQQMALVLQDKGDDPLPLYLSAEDDYSHLLKLNPNLADGFEDRGYLRFFEGDHFAKKGKFSRAQSAFSNCVDDFETAIHLSPAKSEKLQKSLQMSRDKEKETKNLFEQYGDK